VKTFAAAFHAALAAVALAPKFMSNLDVNVGVIINSTSPKLRLFVLKNILHAKGTRAAFKFAGNRHVPLAALQSGYIIRVVLRKGHIRSWP
jgi:hypothetical protein